MKSNWGSGKLRIFTVIPRQLWMMLLDSHSRYLITVLDIAMSIGSLLVWSLSQLGEASKHIGVGIWMRELSSPEWWRRGRGSTHLLQIFLPEKNEKVTVDSQPTCGGSESQLIMMYPFFAERTEIFFEKSRIQVVLNPGFSESATSFLNTATPYIKQS